MTRIVGDFPAPDPYRLAFESLNLACEAFSEAFAADDPEACLLAAGMVTGAVARVHNLHDPAGVIFDPAELFRRAA